MECEKEFDKAHMAYSFQHIGRQVSGIKRDRDKNIALIYLDMKMHDVHLFDKGNIE